MKPCRKSSRREFMRVLGIAAASILFASCADQTQEPNIGLTSTVLPSTDAPTATLTASPTPMPIATVTPEPTATSTPSLMHPDGTYTLTGIREKLVDAPRRLVAVTERNAVVLDENGVQVIDERTEKVMGGELPRTSSYGLPEGSTVPGIVDRDSMSFNYDEEANRLTMSFEANGRTVELEWSEAEKEWFMVFETELGRLLVSWEYFEYNENDARFEYVETYKVNAKLYRDFVTYNGVDSNFQNVIGDPGVNEWLLSGLGSYLDPKPATIEDYKPPVENRADFDEMLNSVLLMNFAAIKHQQTGSNVPVEQYLAEYVRDYRAGNIDVGNEEVTVTLGDKTMQWRLNEGQMDFALKPYHKLLYEYWGTIDKPVVGIGADVPGMSRIDDDRVSIIKTVCSPSFLHVGVDLMGYASVYNFLEEMDISVSPGIFYNATLGLSRDEDGNLIGFGYMGEMEMSDVPSEPTD